MSQTQRSVHSSDGGDVDGRTSRRSSLSSTLAASVFSQRIVFADFYTAIPIPAMDLLFSEFRGTEIRRVPIIRIFGATPKGQKTCTHIHGVFPYLYIPYDAAIENFESRLAYALDKGINASLAWKPNGGQHVYKIVKVTGRKFYGYKQDESVFLKISFYSPISLKKAEELLQSGNILERPFQPFESHIPFILQFFMDFKLYGMNFIHFRDIRFRRKAEPLLSSSDSNSENSISSNYGGLSQKIWNYSDIPDHMFLTNISRRSKCDLEIDVMASEIIVSQSSIGRNPGIEAIWMDEKERRRLQQVEDWANVTIPVSQDRTTNDYVFPREKELLTQLGLALQNRPSPKKPEAIHTEQDESFQVSPFSSQSDSDALPPQASQAFLDELDDTNLQITNQTFLENQSQLHLSQVELNEEDLEVVAMLEEMARNRVEESDSIIASQVGNDESLEEDECYDSATARQSPSNDDGGFVRENDSQEFLTPEMFAYLEECERKALEEVESQSNSSPLKQCDGQFDNSSSSDSSSKISPPPQRRKRLRIEIEEFDEDEPLEIPRSSTPKVILPKSRSFPLSRNRINKRRREGQSDSESQPEPSTSRTRGSLPLKRISNIVEENPSKSEEPSPVPVPDSQNSVVLLEFESMKTSIDVVDLVESSSTENEVENSSSLLDINTPSEDVIIIDNESSTASESEIDSGTRRAETKKKLSGDSQIQTTGNEGMENVMQHNQESDLSPNPVLHSRPSSPENDDDFQQSDQSLGITSFYEYESQSILLGDEESFVGAGSLGENPGSEADFLAENPEGQADFPEGNQGDDQEDNPEGNGILSFYEYSDDSNTSGSSREDVEAISPIILPHSQSPPARDQGESESSIKSVYEYSSSSTPTPGMKSHSSTSSGDTPEAHETSFQDISIDYSQLSHLSNLSSDSSGSEGPDEVSPSEFRRTMNKIKIERRARAEEENAELERQRPSNFQYTIQPLKITPDSLDVFNWLRKLEESGETVQESPMLTYFRAKGKSDTVSTKARDDWIKSISKVNNRNDEIGGEIPGSSRSVVVEPPLKVNDHNVSDDSVSSDEDEDEDVDTVVKRFRFAGGNGNVSGASDSGSDAESDSNTIVQSPLSQNLSPSPVPVLRTPRSRRGMPARIGRRSVDSYRRSLGSQESRKSLSSISESEPMSLSGEPLSLMNKGLLLPKYRPNDSELDSPSSRISESERIVNPEDLDASNFQNVKAFHEYQYLSTMVMEVHCESRVDLYPDPEHDQILGIFYGIHEDCVESQSFGNIKYGHLIVGEEGQCQNNFEGSLNPVEYFNDEMSMMKRFISIISEFDPDILIGYEIQKFSWGYFIERGCKLGLNMMQELSRLLPLPYMDKAQQQLAQESWNESVSGRIVLNLWKLLRHEITVTSYTFENAVFNILHERVHRLTFQKLTSFWNDTSQRLKVIQYFELRVTYTLRLIEKLDLINRTSELARLFGIQFFEVLSRGSQFRVESMMLRLAKPFNLIPPSPNPAQRAGMKAPEYLPLIMEPESKFYTDPVAVLDFQSLYPSMMMAYNYCFSTSIGRVQHLGSDDAYDFGCLSQEISPAELASLIAEDLVHVSPCGVAFVKHQVKRGILGDMLEQILDTRQMVKRAMKKWKDDETLQRVLDSRQLGLKLIANVTYGYTAANFSGRMPCVEIADSVVSKGRETLQRAIDYVKENEEVFGGKVVYGDTDSLFVHFPGKTKEEAFVLAQRIVDDVTALNPKPVKLKLEKIYQPCILQTKKRYVGFAYETLDQAEPKYDAKGIETVRRDGCPAVAKILEGTIKTLFLTKDPVQVRRFVVEQFRKIFLGRVSLSKYTFAREYRGRMGYRPKACVASLEIAKKLAEKDPRSEPLPKERVPYIIVYGNPGSTLISRVRRPDEFIGNPNLRLNSHYYIEKAILPALNRCLALGKLDVFKWYSEMPRRYLKSHYTETAGPKKGTIDQYFQRENCIKCDTWTQVGFCDKCFSNLEQLKAFLKKQQGDIVRKYEDCMKICRNCSGEGEMMCINMSCTVKHKYLRYDRDYLTKLPAIIKLRSRIFGADDDLEW